MLHSEKCPGDEITMSPSLPVGRNGKSMTHDLLRAGRDEDGVTGLPWKSVFTGAYCQ